MSNQPFLTLVEHIQRSNSRREPQQLDLFDEDANEIRSGMLAGVIALGFVTAVVEAGGNLSTVRIQLAANRWRERTAALLIREFQRNS
jgi:hypothetical protein